MGDEARIKQAIAKALRWLARREHCAAELRWKLQNAGFAEDEVDAVIRELLRRDWLSEERFAEAFIRARLRRGDTPWLAAQKALARGADEEAVRKAQAAIEAEVDLQALLQQQIARADPDGSLRRSEKGRARLWRRLQHRGFPAAMIRRALETSEGDEA